MNDSARRLIHLFQEEFTDILTLTAVYTYGRFARSSDSELLIVVNDDANPTLIRRRFLPFWEREKGEWGTPPMIVSQSALVRHMSLNPLWARRVARGNHLYGDLKLALPAEPDAQEQAAYLAWKTMLASAMIAPDLLDEDSREEAVVAFEDMGRWSGEKRAETAVLQLATIQTKLETQLQALDLPALEFPIPEEPLLPGLLAVYKLLDKLVLVFDDSLAQQFADIDWRGVAEMMKGETKGLYTVTAVQLRLILTYETPVAFILRNYKHDWGTNLLFDFAIVPRLLFRAAARKPSTIRIDTFPRAYFTQGDEHLHDIIHDFQNKLLNIQLEHELLYRLQGIEKFALSEPLPGRESDPDVRICAIFRQLDAWTTYYADQMGE